MRVLRFSGIPDDVSTAVRDTMRAPGYGHPAHRETARGYGPCRSCLRTFRTGEEDRILFTYQAVPAGDGLPAPGPVFIHAEACARYDAPELPADVRSLPMIVEGFAPGGWVVHQAAGGATRAEEVIAAAFDVPGVAWVHLRNAEAGCFMARVDAA